MKYILYAVNYILLIIFYTLYTRYPPIFTVCPLLSPISAVLYSAYMYNPNRVLCPICSRSDSTYDVLCAIYCMAAPGKPWRKLSPDWVTGLGYYTPGTR